MAENYFVWTPANGRLTTYDLLQAREKATKLAATQGKTYILQVLEVAERTTPPVVISPYVPQ